MRRHVVIAVWVAWRGCRAARVASAAPRAGAAYAGAFWSPPQWVNIPDFYGVCSCPGGPPRSHSGAWSRVCWHGASPPATATARRCEPPAIVGFVLIPVLPVASNGHRAFMNRTRLRRSSGLVPCGFGRAPGVPAPAVARMLIAALLALVRIWARRVKSSAPPGSVPWCCVSRRRVGRRAPDPDLPLVVADPHTFTDLWHYGAPDQVPSGLPGGSGARAERPGA